VRLLLVEDDVMVASGIKLGLTDAGYTVDWVGSGERAEEVLRTEVFDAAIIDIGLPRMDGYELARRVRAEIDGAHRPYLVAVTGYGLPEDRARTREAGFDLHLVKPVDSAELAEVLAKR